MEHEPEPTEVAPDSPEAAVPDIDAALAEQDGTLAEALRTLLQAPEDIQHRVADTVSEQLANSTVGGVALDLLGLGARTLGTFLTGAAGAADRVTEDDPQRDRGRGVL